MKTSRNSLNKDMAYSTSAIQKTDKVTISPTAMALYKENPKNLALEAIQTRKEKHLDNKSDSDAC